MIKELGLEIFGEAELVLRDSEGNVKDVRIAKNKIVTTGLGHITSRLTGVAQTVMGWMSVGDNNTAAADGQTTLVNELAGGKVALDSLTVVTTTLPNDTLQAVATFPAGTGTGALVEAGIFNQTGANTGTMLNRLVFSVINKGASDALTITWKIRFASGA